MPTIQSSAFRDANRVPIQSLAFIAKKSVTFAAATTGSIAQHDLFIATGSVLITVFGLVNTDLTSGGAATFSIGTSGNVAGILGVVTATTLNDGDVYVDTTDRVQLGPLSTTSLVIINGGQDITYDILTATITDGQIDFYCLWRPLDSGSAVIAA